MQKLGVGSRIKNAEYKPCAALQHLRCYLNIKAIILKEKKLKNNVLHSPLFFNKKHINNQ